MKFEPRVYSMDLAQKALALVRPIVEDLVRARILWEETMEGLALPAGRAWWESPGSQAETLSRLFDRRRGYRRELEALGVHLLDEKEGEVGFPALLEDRLVLLSWRLGEERIQGWRPFFFSSDERGPWFPLSSSPTCLARAGEDWEDLPEILPEEGDFPLH